MRNSGTEQNGWYGKPCQAHALQNRVHEQVLHPLYRTVQKGETVLQLPDAGATDNSLHCLTCSSDTSLPSRSLPLNHSASRTVCAGVCTSICST